MLRLIHWCTLFLLISSFASAQVAERPEPSPAPPWFQRELERNVGLWIADNSKYMDETEPFEQYGIEWKWGLGKMSIEGELFGLYKGQRSSSFWKLVQYWDAGRKEAVVLQFGVMGAVGQGVLKRIDDVDISLTQHFLFQDGSVRWERHETEQYDGYDIGASLTLDKEGEWQQRRVYTWRKVDRNKQSTVDRITTRIDTLPSGELAVVQDFVVEAPLLHAWEAFTTKEGAEKWMAPLVAVDLRNGGSIQVNARKGGVIGDDQTTTLKIVNYLRGKMLTTHIDISKRWPDISAEEATRIFHIIEFEDEGNGQTRVTTSGIGYLADGRFNRAIDYFIRGNKGSYVKLIEGLEAKP